MRVSLKSFYLNSEVPYKSGLECFNLENSFCCLKLYNFPKTRKGIFCYFLYNIET